MFKTSPFHITYVYPYFSAFVDRSLAALVYAFRGS